MINNNDDELIDGIKVLDEVSRCKPHEHALNVIKFKGIGFALPEKMAFDLMDDFGLFLKRQRNDLVGEKSALFKHDGKIYRIQAVSMGAATKYKLYLKD